jgi:hypothetical protein
MYSPKLTNDSLRKKLQNLNLREDDEGYWYYDQFNTDEWMIAAYDHHVRITKKIGVDKTGRGYFAGLGERLNCIDEEEKILKQVNKLLNQVKRLDLAKKKKKMKMRIKNLNEDFQ